MNGGYIMIKASDADIYLEASRALTIGKPILFYENDTTCYYIDTITLDGTNVVLTKGGKTITIANDNTITTSGDIQNHLYKYFGLYVENGGKFSFEVISEKNIDFSTITPENVATLFGGTNIDRGASGVYVIGDQSYAVVSSIFSEGDGVFITYTEPSVSSFDNGGDDNYAFNGSNAIPGDEKINLSYLTITKSQLF